jgi:hypothetical protein
MTKSPTPVLGEPKDVERRGVDKLYQPTPRECAMLILRLMEVRGQEVEGEVSRARISQNTVRRMCGRGQLTTDFIHDLQNILLAAGWCMFCVGPTHYAVIKVKSVEGWSRISSKRISDELTRVSRGQFDFQQVEHLLLPQELSSFDED